MYYVLYVLGKAYWKWLRESAGAVGNKVKLPPYPPPHINLPNCQIRKAALKHVDFSLLLRLKFTNLSDRRRLLASKRKFMIHEEGISII